VIIGSLKITFNINKNNIKVIKERIDYIERNEIWKLIKLTKEKVIVGIKWI